MERRFSPDPGMGTPARRAKPANDGPWQKIGSKFYGHISGVKVRYDHNAWSWRIEGGPFDGEGFSTLTIAQMRVEKAEAVR